MSSQQWSSKLPALRHSDWHPDHLRSSGVWRMCVPQLPKSVRVAVCWPPAKENPASVDVKKVTHRRVLHVFPPPHLVYRQPGFSKLLSNLDTSTTTVRSTRASVRLSSSVSDECAWPKAPVVQKGFLPNQGFVSPEMGESSFQFVGKNAGGGRSCEPRATCSYTACSRFSRGAFHCRHYVCPYAKALRRNMRVASPS